MRGIAACSVLAFCAGCSLLFASNLESDDTPPAQDDAGAPAEASIPADGFTPPPSDATTNDAADASPDGANRFCASLVPAPKFCVDFDTPGAKVADGWDRVFTSPQGVGVVELTDVARDGKAMSVRMNSAPSCSYTRIEKAFATTGKDMRVSFSMRPTTPWTTDAIYAMVRFNAAGSIACQIFLHLGTAQNAPSGGDIHFQYGSGPVDDVFSTAAFPKGDVWSKIEVTVRADKTVLVTVGGTTATDRAFPSGCSFGDEVMVGLGYHCESASPEVRYDDVVVDYP